MSRPPHTLFPTTHALKRADARRITPAAIHAALRWGRRLWSHGDLIYRLDRRSIKRAAVAGCDVYAHEGVTVVVTLDGVVRTVWRNRAPKRVQR